jgi:heavy metal sensor kinase
VIIKTLRFRLTLFYALGVAALLIVFSLVSYFSLKNLIFTDHDKSLEKHINSLDLILKSKLYSPNDKEPNFIIPKKSITELADSIIDIISQEIYVHSILNPKNNFIQVISPTDTIIYESDNMGAESLPIEGGQMDRITYRNLDNFKNSQIRLAVYKGPNYTIAVGIPLKETITTLNNLFTIFSTLVPLTLFLLIIGGWYLTQRSLKPIDDITKIAAEITTKHLHKRIKPSKHDDEISRLITTLNDMIDRLEKSLEKIQQFSADASHELRTPLTILIGELQNGLQKEMNPEDYQHIISNAIDEILVMSRIVEDLLTLYKADVNEINLQLSNCKLDELLTEIYEDSQIISLKKNILVSIDLKDKISILGDKIRLRQLFLNLIENAIKYNVENGAIKITLERKDNSALVSINDTGIGIPPGNENKVFDRFFRVDKSRTRSEGGTGLGLAISKWIVEKHGGTIEFKSEVNRGSTFLVYLPINHI